MQRLGLDRAHSADHPPAPEDVRAELDRILSSPLLQRGGKRRDFLRYIVEETLEGRADNLKGFTIAVDVLGRDTTFDGASDPVVRLEARRLRRDLDSYYFDAGSSDPVRISIPKGAYVPHFEWRDGAPQGGPPPADEPPEAIPVDVDVGRRFPPRAWLAPLALALVALIAIGWALSSRFSAPVSELEPAVVVLPFEALGQSDEGRYLAAGIGQELVGDLMQFPGFRLYALPASAEGDTDAPVLLGQELGVAYVVAGTVREQNGNARVAVQLFDAMTRRVLWSRTYDRPLTPADLIEVQDDLASQIATEVGQPYGAVASDMQMRASTPEVSNMQSYVCVLRAHAYRRNFPRAEFGPLLTCLKGAVRRDPDYSDAWAMLGYLHMDAGRFGYADDVGPAEHYARAAEAATRAVELEPTNALALKALAAINHYQGNYDRSESLARRALKQNPYDPDAMVQLGWRLAVRGHFEEGVPLIERAIARSANPPGWYYHLLAIDCLMDGDGSAMLDAARHASADGSALSQSLVAMAYGLIGDEAAAQDALRRMIEISPGYDPIARFQTHHVTEEILETITAALDRAGWSSPS